MKEHITADARWPRVSVQDARWRFDPMAAVELYPV
jgi:hypothetical protein